MIRDVLISIKGEQEIDGSVDTIEFISDGRFGIRDGKYFISYDESQMLDTNEEVKTYIHIDSDDSLILERKGAINSKMLIEKNNRNICYYDTPHGRLVIGIFGEILNFDLGENGGNIEMSYTIDSDLRLLSRNKINITIKEV